MEEAAWRDEMVLSDLIMKMRKSAWKYASCYYLYSWSIIL